MTTGEYCTLVVLLMAILGNTWLIVALVNRGKSKSQKCIHCGRRPATIHRATVTSDALPYLCSQCAV